MTACNWTSMTIEYNSPNLTINKTFAKHTSECIPVCAMPVHRSIVQTTIHICRMQTANQPTRISVQWTQQMREQTICRHIATVHCKRIQRHSIHLPHQITPIQRPENSCSERTRTLSFVHIFSVLSMQVSTKIKSTKIGILNRSLHTLVDIVVHFYCFINIIIQHSPKLLFLGSGIIYKIHFLQSYHRIQLISSQIQISINGVENAVANSTR